MVRSLRQPPPPPPPGQPTPPPTPPPTPRLGIGLQCVGGGAVQGGSDGEGYSFLVSRRPSDCVREAAALQALAESCSAAVAQPEVKLDCCLNCSDPTAVGGTARSNTPSALLTVRSRLTGFAGCRSLVDALTTAGEALFGDAFLGGLGCTPISAIQAAVTVRDSDPANNPRGCRAVQRQLAVVRHCTYLAPRAPRPAHLALHWQRRPGS